MGLVSGPHLWTGSRSLEVQGTEASGWTGQQAGSAPVPSTTSALGPSRVLCIPCYLGVVSACLHCPLQAW